MNFQSLNNFWNLNRKRISGNWKSNEQLQTGIWLMTVALADRRPTLLGPAHGPDDRSRPVPSGHRDALSACGHHMQSRVVAQPVTARWWTGGGEVSRWTTDGEGGGTRQG
jgi:hypothetical protein